MSRAERPARRSPRARVMARGGREGPWLPEAIVAKRPRIIAPMHPNALLEHATELLHRVLRFEHPADGVVSDFFREHRALGPRERHCSPRRPTRCCAGPAVSASRRSRGKGEAERRLAILGGRATTAFLRAALSGTTRLAARVAQSTVAACPSGCATTCPSGSPGARSRRSAPNSGRSSKASTSRRRSTCASTPSRPSAKRCERAARRRHRGAADAVVAARPAHRRQARAAEARGFPERRGRGAGRRQPAAGAADRREARRDGGRLLRRRRRQDARARRGDAQHRPPLRVRHLGPPPGRVEAAARAQRAVQRASGRRSRTSATSASTGSPARSIASSSTRRAAARDAAPQSRSEVAAERGIDRGAADEAAGDPRRAARLLKPGGRLVYATCSVLEVEGEAVAEEFDAEQADFVRLPAEEALRHARMSAAPPARRRGRFLRLWPHRHATDGFFAAIWQRR